MLISIRSVLKAVAFFFPVEFRVTGRDSRIRNFRHRIRRNCLVDVLSFRCLHLVFRETHFFILFYIDLFCLLSLRELFQPILRIFSLFPLLFVSFLSQEITPSSLPFFILSANRHFSCQISVKISPPARLDLRGAFL